MASIDPCYELSGIVSSRSGDYRISTDDLETFLIPKKPTTITRVSVHESGRGVGYTRSPFAYLLKRVA
jgi:hypothetical protein